MNNTWCQLKEYSIRLVSDIPQSVYECTASVICLGLIVFIVWKGWRKGLCYLAALMLISYVFLLFCSTVFYRATGIERKYDFTPFWSYSRPELMVENIMNVVVFVPVGILSGLVIQGARFSRLASSNERQGRGMVRHGWLIALVIGLCISGSIETIQYFFHRGFAETDDVMHNTLGCIMGYILVKGSRLMVHGLTKKKNYGDI